MGIADFGRSIISLVSGKKNNLIELANIAKEKSANRTTTVGKTTVDRIPFDKLEFLYILDPVAFGLINRYARKAIGSGFKLEGKKKDITYLDAWMKEDGTFLKLNDYLVHGCTFGNGFLEIKFNTKKRVAGTEIIDPKTIKFQTDDRTNKALLNPDGSIVGYVQNKGTQDEKKLTPEQVLHFKLFSISDEQMGVGFLEPLFKDSWLELNIREAIGQSVWRHGFKQFIFTVGNERHYPTKEDMEAIYDLVYDINHRSELVLPDYVKVNETKEGDFRGIESIISYYQNQKFAAFQVPKAIALGLSEEGSRSTLELLGIDFDQIVRAIQHKLAYLLENKLFKLMKERGQISEIPKVIFPEATPSDMNEKATRMQKYVMSGLLTPTLEVENIIRKSEGLPEITREEKSIGTMPKQNQPSIPNVPEEPTANPDFREPFRKRKQGETRTEAPPTYKPSPSGNQI